MYSAADWSATLTDVVPGEPDLKASWQQVAEQVERVLAALPAAPVSAQLRPVRQWCGGESWPHIVDEITDALGQPLRAEAARVVSDVAEAERSAPRFFVHGDFGPHNLLFQHGRISGLIDFAAAAQLVGDTDLRDYALGNFAARVGAGTLYDPAPQTVQGS